MRLCNQTGQKLAFCLLFIITLASPVGFLTSCKARTHQEAPTAAQSIEVTSPDFGNGDSIPARFTCQGENIRPKLQISKTPPATKSIAIIVEDPDAPLGIWDHWLAWNLPPETQEINPDSLPQGTSQGRNSSRKNQYSGPCPPSGTHRYYFRVYALDTVLDLPAGSRKNALLKAMEGHVLAAGNLMGTYQQSRR